MAYKRLREHCQRWTYDWVTAPKGRKVFEWYNDTGIQTVLILNHTRVHEDIQLSGLTVVSARKATAY